MVVCLQVYFFPSLSLPHGIYQIYKSIFCVCNMPNLDHWVNQYNNFEDTTTKTVSKFENHLLFIKTERQKMIHPNSHFTYNERQQKIIELIDWNLVKYKTGTNIQKINEQAIIDNIIEELDNKRNVAINKKEEAILKDETWKYSEEDTLDYIFFLICELTGKLY
jgi:hypothetical protein